MTLSTRSGMPPGTQPAERQWTGDTQLTYALGDQPTDPRSARMGLTPKKGVPTGPQPAERHSGNDAHVALVLGDQGETDRARLGPAPTAELRDPFLAFAASVLDDIERVRIANENRVRQMIRTEPDEDGIVRGFGLPTDHPDVEMLQAMVEALAAIEHTATLQLQRRMRKHPLRAYTSKMRGVGDKQVARLLAAIGDPHWHNAEDRPRTVSELWAYCGFKPGQKRQRGVKSNWSQDAKMRAYLIAESCLKQLDKTCPVDPDTKVATHADGCKCSTYRIVYDVRKLHTRTTQPEWTDLHRHNDALRKAAKTLLRDLWRAARDVHGVEDDNR